MELLVNNVPLTLSGTLNTSSTAFVSNESSLPTTASGTYSIVWDDATGEICTATVTDSTHAAIVRGAEGTAAASHLANAKCYIGMTKRSVTQYVADQIAAASSLLLSYTASTDLFSNTAITANTWTDVHADKTFTADGVKHVLAEIGGGSLLVLSAGCYEGVRLLIDGSTVVPICGTYWEDTTHHNIFAGCSVADLGVLSAGSHTIRAQVFTLLSSNFWLRASTAPDTESYRLIVRSA